MTESSKKMTTLLRLLLSGAGVLILIPGIAGLLTSVKVLFADQELIIGAALTTHDFLLITMMAVVSVCFIATGISLLYAAIRRKTRNVVPGPTLYFLGASLLITAMILASFSAVLPAALLGVVGLYTMWLEYRSSFI